MKRASELISQKLQTMIDAANPGQICSKCRAITALFPYVAWQEKDGQHNMFDIFLHVAKASKQKDFMWDLIEETFVTMMLDEGNPVSLKQAIICASPHLPWWNSTKDKHLVQLWAAAASAVPYTDEIGQSVVDTLLQIASNSPLQPYIPVSMWLWLNKSPPLLPVSKGRYWGTSQNVVEMFRKLGDIETLTSYLLLIWSEWDYIKRGGLDEMHITIREDLSGSRMGYQRKKLLQHLDHILGQLDLGIMHLWQHNPYIYGSYLQQMEDQYGQLKEVLLEVDREAIDNLICKPPLKQPILALLTPINSCRISHNIHVCNSSPMPLVPCLEHSHNFPCTTVPLYHTSGSILDFLDISNSLLAPSIYILLLFKYRMGNCCSCSNIGILGLVSLGCMINFIYCIPLIPVDVVWHNL